MSVPKQRALVSILVQILFAVGTGFYFAVGTGFFLASLRELVSVMFLVTYIPVLVLAFLNSNWVFKACDYKEREIESSNYVIFFVALAFLGILTETLMLILCSS